jgi:hypothetical protein
VDDGYTAALQGLKCLKRNEINLEAFQSHRGCSIAVVHNGYDVAMVGLKCFKEKINK